MQALKTVLLWMLTGVITGAGVAAAVAPGMLAWNNTPGTGTALCDCAKVTRGTASELIRAELVGAAAGALVFLVLGFLLVRAFGKRTAAAASDAPTPMA